MCFGSLRNKSRDRPCRHVPQIVHHQGWERCGTTKNAKSWTKGKRRHSLPAFAMFRSLTSSILVIAAVHKTERSGRPNATHSHITFTAKSNFIEPVVYSARSSITRTAHPDLPDYCLLTQFSTTAIPFFSHCCCRQRLAHDGDSKPLIRYSYACNLASQVYGRYTVLPAKPDGRARAANHADEPRA